MRPDPEVTKLRAQVAELNAKLQESGMITNAYNITYVLLVLHLFVLFSFFYLAKREDTGKNREQDLEDKLQYAETKVVALNNQIETWQAAEKSIFK